jgi:glucose-1-phosphatase
MKLASFIPGNKTIRNIIFDFGGVICNIDIRITEQRFLDMGMRPFDPSNPRENMGIFNDLETGHLSPAGFRNALRIRFSQTYSDRELDDAWNALLLDIPESRIRTLEKIRSQYRIFLLSNTNEIHYRRYVEDFRTRYGYPDFDALFEKAYFSYQLGLRKPDPAIFKYVLEKENLVPGETLFIDDTLQHVESASKLGIRGLHLEPGMEISRIFNQIE